MGKVTKALAGMGQSTPIYGNQAAGTVDPASLGGGSKKGGRLRAAVGKVAKAVTGGPAIDYGGVGGMPMPAAGAVGGSTFRCTRGGCNAEIGHPANQMAHSHEAHLGGDEYLGRLQRSYPALGASFHAAGADYDRRVAEGNVPVAGGAGSEMASERGRFPTHPEAWDTPAHPVTRYKDWPAPSGPHYGAIGPGKLPPLGPAKPATYFEGNVEKEYPAGGGKPSAKNRIAGR